MTTRQAKLSGEKNIYFLMPFVFFILGILLFFPTVTAQSTFYISRNFQTALAQNTRTQTGVPGKAYWQNQGLYTMDVTVNPHTGKVEGQASIRYTNNSPSTLIRLNLKLFQNVHLPRTNRAAWTDDDFLTDGLFITELKANGKKIAWKNESIQNSSDPTNTWISLPKALLPGASVDIELQWHYTVQESVSDHREGRVDQSSLFCAYWYPRISVYDDVNGWDRIPMNNQVEFYNDYNDYDVTIRTPSNYIVWATGELQNATDVLEKPFLDRLNQSKKSDDIIQVVTAKDLRKEKITHQEKQLVWKFQAQNVSDFAFGVSDHFLWDATSIIADSVSNQRISVQTAYLESSTDFTEVTQIARDCIQYFSNHIPGIPYPYPTLSIFNGHGQMEYPMMVNDNEMGNLDDTKALTAHEIAHTYFPFLVGTNESTYAWMDEGWATLFEYFACTELYTLAHPEQAIYPGYYLRRYVGNDIPETEVPIFTPSHQLAGFSFGLNAYGKSAAAYLALHHLLGRKTFLRCLHAYANRWRGKHPSPYDFFFTFEDVSEQDLTWFWQRWFMTYNTMDLALTGYRQEGNIAYVKIQNPGGKPLPIVFDIILADGKSQRFSFSSGLWKDADEVEVAIACTEGAKTIKLVWDDFVDINPDNDRFISDSQFRLKSRLIASFDFSASYGKSSSPL